jgi:hypothetical protein
MDADDIAMPNRFQVQLPLMQRADIVGAGLLEFAEDSGKIVGQRIPPVGQANILRFSRIHDPFNHPTVMYRRSSVVAAGGYGDLPLMEDYWLFARMLDNGARAINVPDPLVYYRVGPEAFKRRGGQTLLRSELRLQRTFRDEGFTTRFEYVRNVAMRGGYRLIPWRVRRSFYRHVVAGYGARMPQPQSTTAAPMTTTRDIAQVAA